LPGKKQIIAWKRELRQAYGREINVTRPVPIFWKLPMPAATKGQALARLAQSLGLEAGQVMAVGDSLNDLDMISYAGLGVAMDNAVPEVKQEAMLRNKKQ
jgi:HAD superfamily hydrolase (TIGR01484 family)